MGMAGRRGAGVGVGLHFVKDAKATQIRGIMLFKTL